MIRDSIDMHTHTIASGHAYNTLYEMVRAAAGKHLELLGITEHGPAMTGSCNSMWFANYKAIPRNLFGVRLLLGCELNIIDYEGNTDLEEKRFTYLDYAIASLHTDCIKPGTIEENTAAILSAMKNPHVKIIGHPDDSRFPLDYEAVVAAAAEHEVFLEVNNGSLNPKSLRYDRAKENYLVMLNHCKNYKVSVIVSSDAHIAFDVANHERALKVLEEVDFPENLVVNADAARFIERLSQIREYEP